MGELYAFDREGRRLHPEDPNSGGITEVTDRDNVVLGLGVHSHGAALQCVVNDVETTVDRVQAILRYETTATTGVFVEFVDAVEEELVRGRGWRVSTVPNEGNPGYVFQRLRDAAAGNNPRPEHLPADHDVVEALVEDGETVRIHVRDFSVAGDMILRYGDVGCNVTVAETSALGTQPKGLVVVQDDSIEGPTRIPEESQELVEKRKIALAASKIEDGVATLAEQDVPAQRATAILDDRVTAHYDDLKVMDPEERRKVSKLFEEVKSLRRENEKLREQNETLQEVARGSKRAPGTDRTAETESTDSTDSSDQETRADGHGGTSAGTTGSPAQKESGESLLRGSLFKVVALLTLLIALILLSNVF